MATKTEEVRTVFRFDVTDVDTANRKIKNGFDNILVGEKKVKKELSGFARELVNVRDGGDVASIAMTHLAKTFKMGIGGFVAIQAGIAAYQHLTEKANELAAAQKGVEDSSIAATQAITFQGTHDGMTGLINNAKLAKKAVDDAKKEQEDLDPETHTWATNLVNAQAAKKNNTTVPQMMADAAGRQKLAQKQIATIREQITKTLQNEYDLQEKVNRSDKLGAKEMEIQRQRAHEIAEIKSGAFSTGGASAKDLALINAKYDLQLKAARAEDSAATAIEEAGQKERAYQAELLGTYRDQRTVKLDLLRIEYESASAQRDAAQFGSDAYKKASATADALATQMKLVAREGMLGKSEKQLNHMMHTRDRHNAKQQRNLDKWNNRQGMTHLKRDMNGDVIGGRDAATGDWKKQENESGIDNEGWFDTARQKAMSRKYRFGASGVDGASNAMTEGAWKGRFPRAAQNAGQSPDSKLLADIHTTLTKIEAKQLA